MRCGQGLPARRANGSGRCARGGLPTGYLHAALRAELIREEVDVAGRDSLRRIVAAIQDV